MAYRHFEFKDAKSDKFWEIELDGNSYTVKYGRRGTSGQTKTKEYDDETKAKKEYDKLIAKKLKSGYVEIGSSTASPEKNEKKPEAVKEAAKIEKKEKPKETNKVAADETLGLPQEEMHRATWRTLPPIPLPQAKPFDRADCEKRLAALKLNRHGYKAYWESLNMPLAMSKKEAHFWYEVITAFEPRIDGKELLERVANREITGNVSFEEIRDFIKNKEINASVPLFKLLLVHLLPVNELASFFANVKDHSTRTKHVTLFDTGFKEYIYPNLNEADKAEFKKVLRPTITAKHWPHDQLYVSPVPFYVAAILGMHEELKPVVESWPDNAYDAKNPYADFYHRPQQVIFGLGSPELVVHHMKRLKLRLRYPEYVWAWLAHTEFEELGYVAESISQEDNKEEAAKLMATFCATKSPKMAGPMLRCCLESKAPAKALTWLNENIDFAIAGLIPVAAGQSTYWETASERLQTYVRQGQEEKIKATLENFDCSVKQSVEERVLNAAGMNIEAFTEDNTPQWLRDLVAKAPKKAKLPTWLNVGELPPIVIGDHSLSLDQMTALVSILKGASLKEKPPLAEALKERADRESLSKFAWKLFEYWQAVGAPSKEKWAFMALGHLGDDRTVFKLTPLIRAWPGEALHARAVTGLQVIRAIGTDTAMQELSGIAAKLKFKGLKKQANYLMEEIARDLGLTRDDLEDRVVPSCGLDERGNRIFDFGPRKFAFVLGAEMKPMVKDDKGKRKTNLPKPAKSDDEEKAKEALDDWKLIKKQIRQVCKIQGTRLEQAMIKGRRWRTVDFKKYIANHPLMTHIGQTLLWGQFSKQGTLLQAFRITEEQDFANEEDDALALDESAVVGLIHPLALPEQQRATWGQVFADYEIIPPFAQLGRTVYSLEKGEESKDNLERFVGLKLPAPSLVFGLEKFGWSRGLAMDAGGFCEHSKIFESAAVTAVVLYEGCVGMQYIEANEQLTVTDVYFVNGARQPDGYASSNEPKLKLSTVDPIVMSEVLHDLNFLASKAE